MLDTAGDVGALECILGVDCGVEKNERKGVPALTPLGFGGMDELCMRTKDSCFTRAVLGFEWCQERGRAVACSGLRGQVEKY